MAVISPASHDSLVVGLGIFLTCTVFITMRQMLIHYRDSAIIPPSENKPKYITQDVEDSLKLSTLEKLLNSPNWAIRNTTSVIICERALHNEATFNTILRHISRAEYATRERGIRALDVMMNNMTIGFLHSPQGYLALTKCLEYCITDYEHNVFEIDWDNWPFRDVVEQLALSLLIKLIEKFGPGRLLQYRFVELWLAKEPWGKTKLERQSNFAFCVRESNQKLNDIVFPIYQDLIGIKQLHKVGLIMHKITNPDERGKHREGCDIQQEFVNMFTEPGRRILQNNLNDIVRRRHREAMVLNDGSRPLAREDIIQRER